MGCAEQVDAMKKKRPWITFAELQEDYKDCKEKLDAAKELLARKQSEVEQAKAPLRCVCVCACACVYVLAERLGRPTH